MKNVLSHTFRFETINSLHNDGDLSNILKITEEDEKKHYIQYVQYHAHKQNSIEHISFRYINVKVDRSYYLEIANINLSERNRRRQLFSILGKRRFGSNSKKYDYYLLSSEVKHELLEMRYKNLNSQENFSPCFTARTEYSTNKYRIHTIKIKNKIFSFLDQINITSRKKLHKVFIVELTPLEQELLETQSNEKKRVNYLFNKIGKIYFKSLELKELPLTPNFNNAQELAESQLLSSSSDMERTSRINDNLVFRILKEKNELIQERIDVNLHTSCFKLLHNPSNNEILQSFQVSIETFIQYTSSVHQLEDLTLYLKNIKSLIKSGTLTYLLSKNDQNLKDIFIYMIESCSVWNGYLYKEDENVKAFNLCTIDFIDALRYLVEMCYKFQHEYKCLDITIHGEQIEQNQPKSIEPTLPIISAQEYFKEVSFDKELYDELIELENDIELLFCSDEYTQELNEHLIHFFKGYKNATHPLYEFQDLNYSLMMLSQNLFDYYPDSNAQFLVLLFRSLVNDLLEWQKKVLVEKTAEDIHFMDKAFYSNIAQIEILMEPRKIEK